jgi:hypothetical protein
MDQQWFLCDIDRNPDLEENRLKLQDNLSVKQPQFSGLGEWLVWLPIIPRVGDILQFPGWPVQVSRVTLTTNTDSQTGSFKPTTYSVAATLHVRESVVPDLIDSEYTVDVEMFEWENYARRGHDLEYYAWELRHSNFATGAKDGAPEYKQWHSRIRPVVGDTITIAEKRWRVVGVELSSPNASVDGWLDLEA